MCVNNEAARVKQNPRIRFRIPANPVLLAAVIERCGKIGIGTAIFPEAVARLYFAIVLTGWR